MRETIGAQLQEKLAQPLKFQWSAGGAQSTVTVHGLDATLLVDVCKAVVEAESKQLLDRQQVGVAKQAHIVLGASAKAGIKGLVYALAGYNPTVREVIDAFKAYIQEEARKYEREFPNELYVEWHRLYDIPVPERGR